MGLSPVVIEQFPGLDLRADPGDSRGAIDLLNVTIEPGRVRVRDGMSSLITGLTQIIYASAAQGDAHIIVADQTNPITIGAYTRAGALVSSYTNGTITDFSGVNIGVTGGSRFYLVQGATSPVRQWNGLAWSSPAGFPANPRIASLSPVDNRLVICVNGATVWFSDPGAPTTFGANNFVTLVPGDGEEIQSAAVFNNQLFVFKKTKFFVFYGNSTDSTGSPVFNYRAVNAGRGSIKQSTAVVGPDGVYFAATDGIYKTTGGPPVCVSRVLDPLFLGGASSFWQSGSVSPSGIGSGLSTGASMAFVGTTLYVLATSSLTLAYDTRYNAWTAWKVGASNNNWALAGLPANTGSGIPEQAVFAVGGTLLKVASGVTTDNGTAIVSRYRLPFETYGTPGEKRIRETILEGTGTPTVQWSDDWGALTTGSAVTLGTSPAVAVGRQRLAQRGRAFSLQLGAASGAWAVNRVQVNVGEGIRGAEVTI